MTIVLEVHSFMRCAKMSYQMLSTHMVISFYVYVNFHYMFGGKITWC